MDPEHDGPMPPVPANALNMMRWEIVLSWSIFPVMDSAIHLGLVDTHAGEAIICGADYAARAGLAIIMTNCNLEQVTTLIAEYLAKEQERTSKLLNSILPKSVARQLAAGKEVEAERHPNVSILFSDIKGFTSISSTVEPKEVMAMLNLLFSKFDALCEKHDVYKVETIGDAYMVVSGLPEKKEMHADALADFALDMIEAAHTVRSPRDGQPLQIRVGLHSGSVTPGVVGKMRPRYCLFGDTVITASRMESTGIPDNIQLSQAFKNSLLAPDAYDILQRGLIEVKGKGMMVTYLLYRPDAEGAGQREEDGLLTSSETEGENNGTASDYASETEHNVVAEEEAARPTRRSRSSSQVGRGRAPGFLSVDNDGCGTPCSPQRHNSLSQGVRSRSVSPGNLSRSASDAPCSSRSPGPQDCPSEPSGTLPPRAALCQPTRPSPARPPCRRRLGLSRRLNGQAAEACRFCILPEEKSGKKKMNQVTS
jgi:class 3 adenylate cyclase